MVKIKVRPRFLSKKSFDLCSHNKKSKSSKEQSSGSGPVNMEGENNVSKSGYVRLETPVKSSNDFKEYRVIRLENGLTALLISDPTPVEESDEEDDSEVSDESSGEEMDEEMSEGDEDSQTSYDVQGHKLAAAGLTIGVGSFSDPEDIPGLAHFLEHMVFMGSEKYPAENSFDAYIKRRGGNSNASTDCERTNFYFEIHKKHLYEALDQFAQFFISPLLKKSSVDREIEAVDSEFQSSLQSDCDRKDQLMGTFALMGHPMRKFMWGNTDTLKITPKEKCVDVYKQLAKFRERYYSSDLMTLAIQSQEDLETLEKWVNEIFSKVPKFDSNLTSFLHFGKPFDTPEFRRLYKIVSVGSSHLLMLNWAFPPMAEYYKEKPLGYILFLIGHEGKGSLLSYLKEKVWALNLWTEESETGFETNSTNSFFSFTIELTDTGLEHLYEVLTAVFSYIEMLKRVGPQERIFKEIKLATDNEFKCQEEMPAVDHVQLLSENMQLYPPIDFITGGTLVFSYNENLIENCLKKLKPDDVNIMVLSKSFESEGICDQKEQWYQTLYTSSAIDSEWLTAWKNIEPYPVFLIPNPNLFIATDFSLKPEDIKKSDVPITILDDPQGRLWYKQDLKFKLPKAILGVHLATPIGGISARNAALADLFTSALDQNLKEDVYPALVAMLEYSIFFDERGMIITVNGFNDKLTVLLETIVQHIARFNVTDKLFDAVKTNIRKNYYNTYIKPHKLARVMQRSIIYNTYWSPMKKCYALDEVTKEMLLEFAHEFRSHLYVECLFQGNLTSDEALYINRLVRSNLNCGQAPSQHLKIRNRTVKLPQGESYCRVAGLNAEDGNSVVVNYYQLGPGTIQSSCMMELVNNFMEEPCFDYLRTREQLGYNVYCLDCLTYGVTGFGVTVQTSVDKYSCFEVDAKIEEFLAYFRKYLAEISEDEYHMQVSSLIKAKQHPDIHLKEEFSRNSSEILNGTYVYDRLEKEVQCLQEFTLGGLREWINGPKEDNLKFRKLSIQVVGNGKFNNLRENIENNDSKTVPSLKHLTLDEYKLQKSNTVTDLILFKESLEVYPVIRITS